MTKCKACGYAITDSQPVEQSGPYMLHAIYAHGKQAITENNRRNKPRGA